MWGRADLQGAADHDLLTTRRRAFIKQFESVWSCCKLLKPPARAPQVAGLDQHRRGDEHGRRTCRNVKWRRIDKTALRWIAAGMLEAQKGFRRVKAHG